jgi:hypothetical protein
MSAEEHSEPRRRAAAARRKPSVAPLRELRFAAVRRALLRLRPADQGLVRHFSSILGDFFDTVFNIDSRVLRTIGRCWRARATCRWSTSPAGACAT